jgi:hypothetical protein
VASPELSVIQFSAVKGTTRDLQGFGVRIISVRCRRRLSSLDTAPNARRGALTEKQISWSPRPL